MATVLMELREEWAVQVVVLVSFTLQVVLLSFARIRRKTVCIVPSMFLWLAYQQADSTALFTLGHMAISSRSWEEQPLMAFWAPFLLIHLGGQDSITAYSYEDNRLWLRHLQTLVAQVVGASYVPYKYMPTSNDTLLMVATVLIFVVGILKYGERVWALRSASFDALSGSMDAGEQEDTSAFDREIQGIRLLCEPVIHARWRGMDVDDILMGAHGLLDVCVGLFVGVRRGRRRRKYIGQVLRSFGVIDRLGILMEMVLSLMHDILYTKATVIHAWYGCCIRVIALVATVVAFLLFQLSSKDGHTRKDVAVTYILLAGAILLEIVSTVTAAGSTWMRALSYKRGWRWIHDELVSLRHIFGVASGRRWPGSIGQYNLLQACARDAEARDQMAAVVAMGRFLGGLRQPAEDCWARLRHAESNKLSDCTKEMVLSKILEMHEEGDEEIGSLRGLQTLKRLRLDDHIGWTVQDLGFDESIMAWHLATDICLFSDSSNKADLLDAIRVLSNYLMFLLVLRPYMLPAPVRRSRYDLVRKDLHSLMQFSPSPKYRREWALREGFYAHINSDDYPAHYDNGVRLAYVLYHQFGRLDIIFGVWVEMLCYVANNCSRESHAGHLNGGDELITMVWLMARLVDLS